MSYTQTVQGWIDGFRLACEHPDRGIDVVKVTLRNYEPRWLDIGADMDRLVAENERLTAIVNLIDMAKERDELKAEVAALREKAELYDAMISDAKDRPK